MLEDIKNPYKECTSSLLVCYGTALFLISLYKLANYMVSLDQPFQIASAAPSLSSICFFHLCVFSIPNGNLSNISLVSPHSCELWHTPSVI